MTTYRDFILTGEVLGSCTASKSWFDATKEKKHIRFAVYEGNKLTGTILFNLVTKKMYGFEQNYLNYTRNSLTNFFNFINESLKLSPLTYITHGGSELTEL